MNLLNQLNLLAFNPVLIKIGPIEIMWYAVLIISGIGVAYIVVQKEMKKRGFHEEFLIDLLIWAIPIAILSARLYYVIFEWDRYKDNPITALFIHQGGLAIHGALIGSFITAYVFTKRRGVSFWKVADIVAPGLLIGQIIGRWGNFMNQEAHGDAVSDTFLQNTIIPDWIMNQMTINGVTYHPTFLYESMWNLVGLVLILLVLRRLKVMRSSIFLFYLVWYSVGRFFIEGMRTDSLIILTLRTAQVVSILTIVIAVAIYVYRKFVMKVTTTYQDQ